MSKKSEESQNQASSGTHLERWRGEIADSFEPTAVTDQRVVHRGGKWSVVVEQVNIAGQQVTRDLVVHPGAVVILTLNDRDEIFLIRQYRQSAGTYFFEAPAGLLDSTIDAEREDPLVTAKRELAEEAGLVSARWNVLVDVFNSPGGSSEATRFYLARDVKLRVGGRVLTGEAEEASLPGVWVPIKDAMRLVFAGKFGNFATVLGVLAVYGARKRDWRDLRSPDAPWKARDLLTEFGRLPVPSGPADK